MLEKSDSGTREVGRFNQPPDKLPSADRPVAVLIGPKTISAGEALAISFIGRPNTRLFGEPSFGFTTALLVFGLPDGALIAIPFAFFADRNGNHYDQQIEPDETLFTDWSFFQSERDEVLQGAKAWLQAHPGCRSATP
jgi:C-terminal processing protease CtpA/Prc